MFYTREKLVFRLSDLKKEPMEWLWPDRIAAGSLTLIDGDPSLGKSLLTLDLAARLTTARSLPDGYVPPQPVSVVLVGHQDGLHNTVLPRLQAAGADLSRVSPGGLQPRQDGVVQPILMAYQDDGHGLRRHIAVGQGPGGRQAGCQIEGQKRLAQARIAVDQRQAAGSDSVGPEPFH